MPMTIEQIRSALNDVNRELDEARNHALSLAADANTDAETMRTANQSVQTLMERRNAMNSALEEETANQSANLRQIRENTDMIKSAASSFRSAGDFFSCIARASDRLSPVMDPRLSEYMNVRSAASGQNLTTDSEGGFLVPPEYSDELLNVATSESVLFNDVSRVPVSGNRLIENVLDQESRKDTTELIKGRNGGLLAYWKGEADELTASRMKFKQETTELHKLTGLCYATEEMLQDLPALSAFIAQGFADEFAFKIDDAILNGSDAGMPKGILNAGNAALVTIDKEAGQEANSIVLNNLLKMWNAMPARNRANAKWYINQDVEIILYQMLIATGSMTAGDTTATFGKPIYIPAGGLESAPNGMILGRPVAPIEQAPALGSKGDIIFADMSQYRWIDKSGINAKTSIHVRFIQDEQAFRFTYRAGGKPIWANSIEAYSGTNKRSPYVTLGARA